MKRPQRDYIIEGDLNNLFITAHLNSVLLTYTPYIPRYEEHYHIDLTNEEAAKLHSWLGKYLNDKTKGN